MTLKSDLETSLNQKNVSNNQEIIRKYSFDPNSVAALGRQEFTENEWQQFPDGGQSSGQQDETDEWSARGTVTSVPEPLSFSAYTAVTLILEIREQWTQKSYYYV